jgi:hypothetical protein
MNDRNQHPTGSQIVTRQFFRVPHWDKTRQAFLLEEVTHDHFMSVEGANHRPNLFLLLHFLPFLQ